MWVVLVVVVILFLVKTKENKVNSNSDQLKLGQVCKFGVEFDNIMCLKTTCSMNIKRAKGKHIGH